MRLDERPFDWRDPHEWWIIFAIVLVIAVIVVSALVFGGNGSPDGP